MMKNWRVAVVFLIGGILLLRTALDADAEAVYVTVGEPGNPDDTTGYGGVGYVYEISSSEVTVSEFQAYRTATGTTGGESYWNDGTRTVGPNAPASFVSVYGAMRCLH